MPSAKELKDELRQLRKSHPDYMPISKLKKGDISSQIERLKAGREETPAPAAVPSASLKKSQAAVETIKEAKRMEFPQKPSSKAEKSVKKSTTDAGRSAAAEKGEKKKSKLDRLMEMMDQMSSSDEE